MNLGKDKMKYKQLMKLRYVPGTSFRSSGIWCLLATEFCERAKKKKIKAVFIFWEPTV